MSVVKVKCPLCGSENVVKNDNQKLEDNNIFVTINSVVNQVLY